MFLKICKITFKNILKCCQLISDNEKIYNKPKILGWIQATMQQNTKIELMN